MKAQWRPMRESDLDAVDAIAAFVHTNHPESPAVFAERLKLYPGGCFVLEEGKLCGYCVSHPWNDRRPPALDSLLGKLPDGADTYYLHDIALLPDARGAGASLGALELLLAEAKRAGCKTVSLIAIKDYVTFWERQGFETVDLPELAAKLKTYGHDARYMRRSL